jgi:hypothetical protein
VYTYNHGIVLFVVSGVAWMPPSRKHSLRLQLAGPQRIAHVAVGARVTIVYKHTVLTKTGDFVLMMIPACSPAQSYQCTRMRICVNFQSCGKLGLPFEHAELSTSVPSLMAFADVTEVS